jgi:hypothetical protein
MLMTKIGLNLKEAQQKLNIRSGGLRRRWWYEQNARAKNRSRAFNIVFLLFLSKELYLFIQSRMDV